MSIFSGKCDFYDHFCMIGNDGDEEKIKEKLKSLTLYVYGKDGRHHLVKSDTIKDIAKYYPYLVSTGCCSKEHGEYINLSADCYIDREEREHLQWRIDSVFAYWRKCKRNKQPFTEEGCLEACKYWARDYDGDVMKQIISRVAQDGKNANFNDIHLPMWEKYRRLWFDELVRLGYDENEAYNWCYKALYDGAEIKQRRLGVK